MTWTQGDEHEALGLYRDHLEGRLAPSGLVRLRVLLLMENPRSHILSDDDVLYAIGVTIGARIALRRLLGPDALGDEGVASHG